MLLYPGAEGIDYSFDRPNLDTVKAVGKTFVMRYLGVGLNAKFMSAGERDAIFSRGLGILAHFETSGTASLGGYTVGISHGQQARSGRSSVGYPDNLPIFFAIDFDASSDQLHGPVAQYLRGIQTILRPDQIGVYGGWSTIDQLPPGFGGYCQTYAWSQGRIHPRANIYQYKNGVNIGGGDCDLNRVINCPTEFWAGMGSPTTIGNPVSVLTRQMHIGMTGNDIRQAQARFRDRGWTITVDGSFGPQTLHVVRQFQAEKHLTVDGIIGPQTWYAMWTSPTS